MSNAADPSYDLIGAIDVLAPGLVLQREYLDAVDIGYVANDFQPLTAAQVLASLQVAPVEATPAPYVPTITPTFPLGALPTYPTGLPRFADSNPASDGWSIDCAWAGSP